MKTTVRFLSLMTGIVILISCGSKDYKNQPWMPSKAKNKPLHGHSKKAYSFHREYDHF